MSRLLGLTGPSTFTDSLMEMIEDYFHANFVLLYHNKEENLNEWLKQVDGVILAGGVDIHPTVYGESVLNACNLSRFDLNRDIREVQVINYALESKKPVLGICRGHQLLGIWHGLHMVPDISSSVVSHNPTKCGISLTKNEPMHYVKILEKEIFKEEYGVTGNVEERKIISKIQGQSSDRIWVNSFHHQGLAFNPKEEVKDCRILGVARVDLGKNLDYIVEMMDGTNWLSCQWHPEYDWRENSYSRAILARFKRMLKWS